jgi:hypothetical protein
MAPEMVFDVKTSAGVPVRGKAHLSRKEGRATQLPFSPFALEPGGFHGLRIAFDPTKLLDGIDFDAVAGCSDTAGCRDFAINAESHGGLLPLLEENLFGAFGAVERVTSP